MHPLGAGDLQANRVEPGGANLTRSWLPQPGSETGANWINQAEEPLPSSDKHFQDDRALPPGPTVLPTVWHPNLEKHWHAVDDGGAELMRAAFGAPARPAPLRIAPPPSMAGEPPPELQQPAPKAINQDPQLRFRASMMLTMIAFVVLIAAAFTPSLR